MNPDLLVAMRKMAKEEEPKDSGVPKGNWIQRHPKTTVALGAGLLAGGAGALWLASKRKGGGGGGFGGGGKKGGPPRGPRPGGARARHAKDQARKAKRVAGDVKRFGYSPDEILGRAKPKGEEMQQVVRQVNARKAHVPGLADRNRVIWNNRQPRGGFKRHPSSADVIVRGKKVTGPNPKVKVKVWEPVPKAPKARKMSISDHKAHLDLSPADTGVHAPTPDELRDHVRGYVDQLFDDAMKKKSMPWWLMEIPTWI